MAVEAPTAITRRQWGGASQPPSPLLVDAMILAREHGLGAHDAVQLAATREVNRLYHVGGAGTITPGSADQELNTAAVAEGLLVEDPSTWP